MVKVEIKKPIFSKNGYIRVGIRDKYVNEAIRKREYLEIQTPDGNAIIDPKKILEKGDKMEQVFKYPESPMKIYHFTFRKDERPETKSLTPLDILKQAIN